MADETDLSINIGSNPAGVESGSKRAKTAVGSVTKETKDLDAALRRLRSSIDPTFAAQEKYNKALADNKRLVKEGLIDKQMQIQGNRAAKAALDAEVGALQRRTAAGQAAANASKAQRQTETEAVRKANADQVAATRAATAQRIEAARRERREKERLEQQERTAIRLAAQLARQAAVEASRTARPVSQRAIGTVAPGSVNTNKSIGTLENDISRAMSKLQRLTAEAEAAAVRAASSSSQRIAQIAQQTAQRRAQSAQETRDRILQMERELASSRGVIAQQEAAADRAISQQKKADARAATQAAAKAAVDRRQADKLAAASSREAKRATQEQARAEREAVQATHDLRSSIDPAYAAQSRYNDVMSRASALLFQNKLKTGEWVIIQKQAKAQMDVNIRSLGKMNTVGVQLGYQMQDVAASVASGINPLVILAQQGGQTASALAMMGGKAGKVASILAGVWVQAALAAVVVCYQLFKAEKDTEKSTVDLMNAESTRAAKLPDLIAKVREFIVAQREQNNVEAENLRIKQQAIGADAGIAKKNVDDQTKALSNLKVSRDLLMKSGDPDSMAGLAGLEMSISSAEKKLKSLQGIYNGLQRGGGELRVTEAIESANSKLDETSRINYLHDQQKQKLIKAQRSTEEWINRHLPKEKQEAAFAKATADASTLHLANERARQAELAKASGSSRGSQIDVDSDMAAAGDNAVRQARAKLKQVKLEARKADTPAEQQAATAAVTAAKIELQKATDAQKSYNKAQREGIAAGKEAVRADTERQDRKIAFVMDDDSLTRDQQLTQVMVLEDEKLAIVEKAHGKASDEYERALQERLKLKQRFDQLELKSEMDKLNAERDKKLQSEDTKFALGQEKTGQKDDNVQTLQDLGLISEKQAATARVGILNEEFNDQQAHEERILQLKLEYMRREAQLPNQSREHIQQINQQIELSTQESLDKRAIAEAKHARDIGKLNAQQANLSMKKWEGVTSALTGSLAQAFQGLLTSQTSVAGALWSMAQSQINLVIGMGQEALQKFIMQELVKRGAAQTTAAVQAGAAATGAAASTAATAGAATAEISANAGVAAAGAYKSTVVIPFIGPVAAPAAAALALAAVLGFASLISAEGGMGEVPGDQLAMVHKKEMILPAWIAGPMRENLKSGGNGLSGAAVGPTRSSNWGNQFTNPLTGSSRFEEGSGGSGDMNVSIQAFDRRGVSRLIKNNRRDMVRELDKAKRDKVGSKGWWSK